LSNSILFYSYFANYNLHENSYFLPILPLPCTHDPRLLRTPIIQYLQLYAAVSPVLMRRVCFCHYRCLHIEWFIITDVFMRKHRYSWLCRLFVVTDVTTVLSCIQFVRIRMEIYFECSMIFEQYHRTKAKLSSARLLSGTMRLSRSGCQER
jgi:hypothetical protein